MSSHPDKIPNPIVIDRPTHSAFLNLIYTDPEYAEFFAYLVEIAETRNSGVARTFLHEMIEDETIRATLEQAFDGRDERAGTRPDHHPVPPNIHEQTRIILDSGLGHLMMGRMPSDIPQSPPFDCEFWVETRFNEQDGEDDDILVRARWAETSGDIRYFSRAWLRAAPGVPFGHDGHDPLSDEHMEIVQALTGWRVALDAQ